MTEKKLKELLDKIDVNHPMGQVIRSILSQYTGIKQTKLLIRDLTSQYKLDKFYEEVMKKEED